MADQQRSAFDPSKYLTRVGGSDYLEVKWRLAWLRADHPDAVIETDLKTIESDEAIFKATVSIPGGGSATGWGSESSGDFRDFLEKAECAKLNTRILTRRGFVSHDEVVVGEDVLSYNIETDRCEWTPLARKVVYEDAPVVRIGHRDFDAVVTPDHTWATAAAYRSWVSGEATRRMKETRRLGTSDRLILSAPGPVEGTAAVTSDEAALIGWMVTDGSIWQSGHIDAMICQSKEPQVARIEAVISAVGIPVRHSISQPGPRTFPKGNVTERPKPFNVWSFRVAPIRDIVDRAGLTSYADLPAFVTTLSQPARAAMLEAMMDADGDDRGYFGKKRKAGVQEAWQILCTLEGHAVGMRRNEATFPVQRMKRRRYLSCQSGFTVEDAGVADVWCPTTANGTWVARFENGQVAITGNTKAIGRALAALGYGTQFAPDHEFGAGQGRVVDSPVDFSSTRGRRLATPDPAPAGPPAGDQTVTPRQLKFIQAIAREAGVDEQQLQDECQRTYGKPIAELGRRDASAFIERLQNRRTAADQ